VDKDDEEFQESNLMHSINGYVYGNMPLITMHQGERVRWYTMGMGTEVDLHTPHWHGNTLLVNGMRMDVVQLLPAGMVVGNMVPDDPGTWLFHCHVNDHILAGMLTRYQVLS
jgi:manganese oxidase